MGALDEGRLAEIEAAARGSLPLPWRSVTSDDVLALVAEVRAARAALGRVEALADEWSALCPPGEWPDEGGIDHAVLADAGRMMLAALREALAGAQEPSSDEVAPGPTDDATGPQIAAQDCLDCEWVARPQRWVDMANGVEPELVPGRACARHRGITYTDLADAAGRARRAAQERLEGGR